MVIDRSNRLCIKFSDVSFAVDAVTGNQELGLLIKIFNILDRDLQHLDHELEVGLRDYEIAGIDESDILPHRLQIAVDTERRCDRISVRVVVTLNYNVVKLKQIGQFH